MIYLRDPDVTILLGDAVEQLRTLPDESVHMAVTSPPFYGLRDYGTASWDGGDAGCDHLAPMPGGTGASGLAQPENGLNAETIAAKVEQRRQQYRDVCGKCGARRVDQQIGLEETPDEWCARLVDVFREVRRVLRADGTLWVEVGDSFNSGTSAKRKPSDAEHGAWSLGSGAGHERVSAPGLKTKDLIGAPWMLALALRADGWYLRADIIWHRPNPMPESVTDRPTKAHSYVFLLSRSARYHYDADAIREPAVHGERFHGSYEASHNGYAARNGRESGPQTVSARNKRSVWTIPTQPLPFDHYAAYPEKLVEPCILAGTSEHGVCSVCGAPWERETEKSIENPGNRSTNGQRDRTDFVRGFDVRREISVTTTGWRPGCDHDAPTIPATVLDPFLGSGTTSIVARRLGRRSIGVELNPKYADLAAGRLSQQSLLALEGA